MIRCNFIMEDVIFKNKPPLELAPSKSPLPYICPWKSKSKNIGMLTIALSNVFQFETFVQTLLILKDTHVRNGPSIGCTNWIIFERTRTVAGFDYSKSTTHTMKWIMFIP